MTKSDCPHNGKKIYVERKDGVWMVCKLCGKYLAIATKFEQRDIPDNLFEQIVQQKILEK
jgi:ribosomal protein L37AE/L43A